MKYLNLFFAAIFMLFSLVQFNDPDPLLWITLYAYVTAMFVMEFLGKSNRWALAAGVLVYFPLAAYYFPGNISDWIAAE
ncbi:MAG TPA: transmembrane 220 family protein, partial [Cytophagaceae bacterium]